MLPLKYAANRDMRIICAKIPCLTSPAGCSVDAGGAGFEGGVDSEDVAWEDALIRCAFSFSITGTVAGGCRCLRPWTVMLLFVAACIGFSG
jgi:hypothetical protein